MVPEEAAPSSEEGSKGCDGGGVRGVRRGASVQRKGSGERGGERAFKGRLPVCLITDRTPTELSACLDWNEIKVHTDSFFCAP